MYDPDVVSAGDVIYLYSNTTGTGNHDSEITVPSELAIVSESKLSSTSDTGWTMIYFPK